ncbi:unnamed protein product [Trichobilharzia regenti]|nr:unnamed protein product [Trichobilharzia regenti]
MRCICGHDINTKLRLLFLLHRPPYWLQSDNKLNDCKWNFILSTPSFSPSHNIIPSIEQNDEKDSVNSHSCDTSTTSSYQIYSNYSNTISKENNSSEPLTSSCKPEKANEIQLTIADPLGFISNKYSSRDLSEHLSLNYSQFQCLIEVSCTHVVILQCIFIFSRVKFVWSLICFKFNRGLKSVGGSLKTS